MRLYPLLLTAVASHRYNFNILFTIKIVLNYFKIPFMMCIMINTINNVLQDKKKTVAN